MCKYPNVSAKLVLRSKGRVLVLQHRTNGVIDFPGGQVEWGETPIEALRRELVEELEYILPGEPILFDAWNYISADKSRHSIVLHYLFATNHRPELKATSEEPDAAVIWMSKDDLGQVIHDPAFVERVFSQSQQY